MNISEICDQLKIDEGFRPHVYKDHLGYETIGYGFLVDRRRGGGLPREIADYWLEQEVIERTTQLHRRWLPFVDQPERVQHALINMSFQLGVNGVLNFKRMLAALKTGDRKQAAREALASRWATQTPNRAKRIASMIRGDDE